ncbi:peptidylprolyl isomerase a [Stylonychia lemnae]|uniref:Peptidyl-prolyl cis-trans isomerase n=1 Tax=Stylonychia lemnae TaxID=5949 RepID=A0A077ZSV5_STYLE|nr:peptidylprolyl isomerase a [Stylonychia lemnae]|eukprot:CDW72967.1 peptidylprolyl isomerase a [Stylonychia lemnae]
MYTNKSFQQLMSFVGKRQFSLYNYRDTANPRVFFTVSKNGQPLGDLVFELYRNHTPQHAENVLSFATGDNKWKASYSGSLLNKGFPGIVLQGGRITDCNASVNGGRLPDEGLHYMRHHKRGQLSMVNDGENANGHEFMITLGKVDFLDGYHTVVGELVEGEEVLNAAESSLSRLGHTVDEIKIEHSGTR